jgi:hypothetical protein
MGFKDKAMYMISVPAVSYAIYEGSFLFGFINNIKENNPECYQTNPNKWELFIGTQIALALFSLPI